MKKSRYTKRKIVNIFVFIRFRYGKSKYWFTL